MLVYHIDVSASRRHVCSTLRGHSYGNLLHLCRSHAVKKFSSLSNALSVRFTNSASVYPSFFLFRAKLELLKHATLAFAARHFDRHAFIILLRRPLSCRWFAPFDNRTPLKTGKPASNSFAYSRTSCTQMAEISLQS